MAFKCGHQFHEHCLQNNWTCPKCNPVKIEKCGHPIHEYCLQKNWTCPKCNPGKIENRPPRNISTETTNRESAASSEPRTESHYSTGFPPGRFMPCPFTGRKMFCAGPNF